MVDKMDVKYLKISEKYKQRIKSKENNALKRKINPAGLIEGPSVASRKDCPIIENIEKNHTPSEIQTNEAKEYKNEDKKNNKLDEHKAEVKDTKKFPRLVGIKNFKVNCYINASLQCLLCIPELSDYFLEKRFTQINYETKSQQRSICNIMTEWYEGIFYSNREIISPKAFVNMCPSGEQDAHEFFFNTLFPLIQKETDCSIKIQRDDTWNSEQVWDWYRNVSRNIFDELFGGLYKNTIVCGKCEYNSVTYDPFLGISLAISGSCLYDCLDKEFKKEKLPKCVGYKCFKCEDKTPATRREKIEKAPKYLILHLKRLIKNSRKVSDHVRYPITLNLSDYFVDKNKNITYDLIAVCVHLGQSNGGHFYSLGKRNKKVIRV